jgi:hypothetical protein
VSIRQAFFIFSKEATGVNVLLVTDAEHLNSKCNATG